MKPFAYVNAANEKEAVAALGPDRGKFLPIAGGMDLLALMKDYVAQPERIVNVKNLDRTIARTAVLPSCSRSNSTASASVRGLAYSNGLMRRLPSGPRAPAEV